MTIGGGMGIWSRPVEEAFTRDQLPFNGFLEINRSFPLSYGIGYNFQGSHTSNGFSYDPGYLSLYVKYSFSKLFRLPEWIDLFAGAGIMGWHGTLRFDNPPSIIGFSRENEALRGIGAHGLVAVAGFYHAWTLRAQYNYYYGRDEATNGSFERQTINVGASQVVVNLGYSFSIRKRRKK